jgi:hypothetical protein
MSTRSKPLVGGPTEQYPAELEALVLGKGAPAAVLYRASYVTHPSPLARWDVSYCAVSEYVLGVLGTWGRGCVGGLGEG